MTSAPSAEVVKVLVERSNHAFHVLFEVVGSTTPASKAPPSQHVAMTSPSGLLKGMRCHVGRDEDRPRLESITLSRLIVPLNLKPGSPKSRPDSSGVETKTRFPHPEWQREAFGTQEWAEKGHYLQDSEIASVLRALYKSGISPPPIRTLSGECLGWIAVSVTVLRALVVGYVRNSRGIYLHRKAPHHDDAVFEYFPPRLGRPAFRATSNCNEAKTHHAVRQVDQGHVESDC
ncbi:hypothetical protein BDN72DRAFT_864412 [Pluteus cervinus]|uniref:Uncharacterized protein n=1 Tax=Pluteus cervinus TaxID=181527 RepID=A0ACD3A3S4_9AGAR|nr:hypothetical protein BDN72DRAFT_864412 [Pluteus cervinus]